MSFSHAARPKKRLLLKKVPARGTGSPRTFMPLRPPLRAGSNLVRGRRMDDGKDDDDMDAVLNKNSDDAGKRKGKVGCKQER
jgi:hypothetical protein